MTMNRALTALLLFISIVGNAQDNSICYLRDSLGRIREHNADFLTMQLDIKLKPAEGKVIGRVQYTFKPIQYTVDTLFLNAPAIAIKKVLLDGKEAAFDTNSEGLIIRFKPGQLNWNKQYKLDITYEATPHKGLYFVGWNVTDKTMARNFYYTRKQVWTQGQGIDNRHWFPCYDDVNDKLITETIVTFDSAYTVISNGVLKQKKLNTDGTATWHYAMSKPMVPYLVMLAIDKYAYKDYKSKSGVVSRQYYYSDRPQTAEPTYRQSSEMMNWFEDYLQVKYPWETYCNVPVQDFMYGAMENTTATVYGDFYLNDARTVIERGYMPTNAHELAHQWFGDYITEYSATHHWLHESFATVYSKWFMQTVYGPDYYEDTKLDEARRAIQADAADRFPVAHTEGGSSRHYPKGSFVVDMLRYVVGDSVYRRTITNYLKKHAYANVSTHDFMMAFMETAGVNLDWFFAQWVRRAGIPNYQVSYAVLDTQVAVYIQQTHTTDVLTGYFKMPIELEVHYYNGTTVKARPWVYGPADTVYLSNPTGSAVKFALFDPGYNVLKTVTFNKGFDELKWQMREATHMADRLHALQAMQAIDLETKRDFLIEQFDSGDYHLILSEIIDQLADDTETTTTLDMLNRALKHPHFLVRRAVVEKVKNIPDFLVPAIEELLTDTSYYTIETALRKLCKQRPERLPQYLLKVEDVLGINNNVRIAYLELTLKSDSTNQPFVNELVGYTSNRFEFRTRVKAIEAIQRLKLCNDAVIRNLFNAALYTNNRLNGPATGALKALLQKPENKQLAKGILELTPWQPWEQKILAKLVE